MQQATNILLTICKQQDNEMDHRFNMQIACKESQLLLLVLHFSIAMDVLA